MIVKELIEKLKSYPEGMKVVAPLWSDLANLNPPHTIKVIPQYSGGWFEEYHEEQHTAHSGETEEVVVLEPVYPSGSL